MSRKSNRLLSILGRAFGALFIALTLSGAAFAQQPIKVGMSMPQTGSLGAGGQAAKIGRASCRERVSIDV